VLAHLGTVLIAAGLGGLLYVGFGPDAVAPAADVPSLGEPAPPRRPEGYATPPSSDGRPAGWSAAEGAEAGSASPAASAGSGNRADRAPPASAESGAITRVIIASISLDAAVVPARLLDRGGAVTWDVPAFKAGHAELSAGAGAPGTAILLGHVSSRAAGDVFRDLQRVQPGDEVRVFSGPGEFRYRVTAARSVPRTDTSVLRSTEAASLVLITCTGLWVPIIWDYTERRVVQAELTSPAGA
jgi:LPXTG-site transpeptidase (sortase) family protein